jgi:hypothetical protein
MVGNIFLGVLLVYSIIEYFNSKKNKNVSSQDLQLSLIVIATITYVIVFRMT